MSRRRKNDVPVEPTAVPEKKAEVEAKTAPEGGADDGREAREQEIFTTFMEASFLLAKVLERQVDEASRRGADDLDLQPETRGELEALTRYKKQIQEIIRYLQALKKSTDERLKEIRELRSPVRPDWF